MYAEHPNIIRPESEDTKIWRYFDFTKFVSFLEKKALFFSKVQNLSDPFEGYYPKANLENNREFFLALYKHFTAVRELIMVNCWHMNEYESAAMWELYSGKNAGIAIQSSFKRLAESFSNHSEEVYIGKVSYINFEMEQIPLTNAFYPFMNKRKDFEYEREIRAIILKMPQNQEDGRIELPREMHELGGQYTSVDLDSLIETVYIAPNAPRWFEDLVQSMLRLYKVDKAVIKSRLSEAKPIEVFVTGAVLYPMSIVPLPAGSCVQDAIDAVGGLTDKADVADATNFRHILKGGETIHVPEKAG